ncbi:endolytic transglycosylase MltG [Alteribacillus iranensis]|uniref:YceG-like family protein n=1 Tax=Alteribacillus iranensis TaxID=930128 RepID=A0A1I1ZDI9_9BACI|nr:endolytic transglycosylase MltG [Alteribacillus iranensis]SFE29821.1 YceG-like family protein [Alteribacillus iranensis]
MSRQSIRLFAAGWFLSACLSTAAYYIIPSEPSSENTQVPERIPPETESTPDIETAVHFLEDEGYKVVEAEEFDEIKNTEGNKVRSILHIEEGMSSDDVADLLQELEIIEDAGDFANKLENSGKTTAIKTGTYKLHNQMNHQEVIAQITN